MNDVECLRLIEKIGATNSRIEKEALLTDLAAEDLGRFVLWWTYNPFITFGLKPKKPGSEKLSTVLAFTDSRLKGLLTDLSERKLTGKAAEDEVKAVMASLTDVGADLLFRILSKDLKCGIGATMINLAIPDMVPTFSVMRAHTYKPDMVKTWPVKVEPKLDGNRNTFLCREGKGGFFTRSGKLVPALDFMTPDVLKVAEVAAKDEDLRKILIDDKGTLSFMLDGEAMMGLFNSTGALRRKSADAKDAELHLYDIMSYEDFNATGAVGMKMKDRREMLVRFVRIAQSILGRHGSIQMVPQYFANSNADIQYYYDLMLNKPLAVYLARGDQQRLATLTPQLIDPNTDAPKNLEGLMVKDPEALYEKRKSRHWLKIKAEETEDLIIIGAFPGDLMTKYENCLGGLIVDRNGVEVRVGGGFSDEQRLEIWDLFQTRDVARHPNDCDDRGGTKGTVFDTVEDINGSIVGRMIEVKFHEVTPDGSLRHPRFVRFRDDKQGEKE